MSHADASEDGYTWVGVTSHLGSRLVGVLLVAALGVAILRVTFGRPDWIRSWHVTAAFLLLAGSLIVMREVLADDARSDLDAALTPVRIGLLAVLLVLIVQSRTPGYGLGIERSTEVVVVFLVLLASCVLAVDPREYSPGQWLFVACFGIVAGIFFYHGLSVGEVSARSRHPLWWGVLVGVNLFVVPRYVTSDEYLWSLNRLAAGIVLIALPIYVIGEYSLFGIQVTFHNAYDLPVLGREVRATRSVFVNRNTFSEVVFVGVVAGVAEVHRTVTRRGTGLALDVAVLLLAVNSLGLALAYDRAMWVLTPMAVGIYLAYVAYGRRWVRPAVIAAFVYLLGGLLAVYVGILETDTSNRFALWRGGVAAIADNPSLLGEGLVSPGRFMSDYHDLGGVSPHNSFVSIWIRTGFLGGIAYATLVLGSVAWGAVRYRDVDVAALAIAAGFGAHQLFEAYTLFQSGIGSVLATLAVGFLLVGRRRDGGQRSEPEPGADAAGETTSTGDARADYVGTETGAPRET